MMEVNTTAFNGTNRLRITHHCKLNSIITQINYVLQHKNTTVYRSFYYLSKSHNCYSILSHYKILRPQSDELFQ